MGVRERGGKGIRRGDGMGIGRECEKKVNGGFSFLYTVPNSIYIYIFLKKGGLLSSIFQFISNELELLPMRCWLALSDISTSMSAAHGLYSS